MSGFVKVFSIYTAVTSDSPLVQWAEVPGQLGLIHCTHQNTSNMIIMAVKTDKIMVSKGRNIVKNKYSSTRYYSKSKLGCGLLL